MFTGKDYFVGISFDKAISDDCFAAILADQVRGEG